MTASPHGYDQRIPPVRRGTLVPRLLARVVDCVVLAAVGVGLLAAFGPGFGWLMLQAVIVLGYFVLCDVIWGATPGKRLLRLRVTGPDGAMPTVRQAVIREAFILLGAVPYAGPVLAAVAWAVIATSIRASPVGVGRHDVLAGGTRVLAV